MTVVSRARRFQLPMRVLWRHDPAGEWLEGMSLNTSRTGVLFQSDRAMPVGTSIDMVLAVSWEPIPSVDVADVVCTGCIVRVETGGPPDRPIALAATIDWYSLTNCAEKSRSG